MTEKTTATLPNGEQVELTGIDPTTAARSNQEKPDLAALSDALDEAKAERRDAKDAYARGDGKATTLRKRIERARKRVRDASDALEEAREDTDVIDQAREAVAAQHEAEQREAKLVKAAAHAQAARTALETMMQRVQDAQEAQQQALSELLAAERHYPGDLVHPDEVAKLRNYVPHSTQPRYDWSVPAFNMPLNTIQGALVPLIEDHGPEEANDGTHQPQA